MRYLLASLFVFAAAGVFAQSGRVVPDQAGTPGAAAELTVKQMFDEANGYITAKGVDYDAKKVLFSERLLNQAKLEQRQLAARYAATAAVRKDLAGDDYYYLGMLHWIAENLDGTVDNLRKFIAFEGAAADRRQTARSIAVVVLAKQRKLDKAEALVADYLKSEPMKLAERARMEGELAKAYQAQKDFARMAPHAEADYDASKKLLKEASSRAHGLDEILDAGMLVYEAYRAAGDQKRAEASLDDMRAAGASFQSPSLYYYAADQKIKYLIETGRKPRAMEFYQISLVNAGKDFAIASQQTDAINRLKKREKHYQLLGETAPELPMVDQWFPGKPKTFADLKGKVVLLDFWATWCGPCIEAFPSLKEWHEDFSAGGLEILGVTRYYGEVDGEPAENPAEMEDLKRFRKSEKLPYDFVVAKDQSIQLLYGGTALPTTVLIDRRGVIRYIESGTSETRLEQIREMILKLLAEK